MRDISCKLQYRKGKRENKNICHIEASGREGGWKLGISVVGNVHWSRDGFWTIV